jgi:hypothetical protein
MRGLPLMRQQAIGHYANGGPVIGGQLKAASRTPALAMRLRGGYELSRGSVSMPVRRLKPSHVDAWVADMIEQG